MTWMLINPFPVIHNLLGQNKESNGYSELFFYGYLRETLFWFTINLQLMITIVWVKMTWRKVVINLSFKLYVSSVRLDRCPHLSTRFSQVRGGVTKSWGRREVLVGLSKFLYLVDLPLKIDTLGS